MAEQRFSTPQPVRLEVKVPVADVDVATIDGDESTVWLSGAQKLIDATRVDLVGNRLSIQQQRKAFGGLLGRFDGRLHVRVRVPHGSRVEIMTASGDAMLDGRFTGLDTKSASGEIRVTGELDGNALVHSVSGDVRLPRVVGDVTVRTVSGDLAADSVAGSISVQSVSGGVRVDSLRDGKVTVQSVSGDVVLGIAPGMSLDVDVGSASGKLTSEVELSSTAGDGDATVVVRGNTASGDFRLFRAA